MKHQMTVRSNRTVFSCNRLVETPCPSSGQAGPIATETPSLLANSHPQTSANGNTSHRPWFMGLQQLARNYRLATICQQLSVSNDRLAMMVLKRQIRRYRYATKAEQEKPEPGTSWPYLCYPGKFAFWLAYLSGR